MELCLRATTARGATSQVVHPYISLDELDRITTNFCAAAETGRDVTEQYTKTPVGLLPQHKFVDFAATGKDFDSLLAKSNSRDLAYVVEAYVDDHIAITTPALCQELIHVANALMTGIHDVFPADIKDSEDPISLKQMKQLESM